MAVAYGSSSSTGANDALQTSIAVPVPSGVQAGHHVYVVLEQWEVANPTVNNTHGFELVGQVVSGPQKLKVFCKLCSGADSGSYTFSWTGTQWSLGHAVRVTGAKQVNNPTATAFNGATSASGTAIPNTSVTVGYIPGLLQFSCNENAGTQTTQPTNFTEVQDSNYLHSNHRMNAVASGTFTAPSGVMSASTLILAMLAAIEPDAGGGTPINVNLSRAVESNSVNALGRAKTVPVSRSAVIDLGRGLIPSKLKALGRATSPDSARSLVPSKMVILTRSWGFDVAKALSASKMISFGRVIENDTARTVSSSTFQTIALGRVIEIDTVGSLTSSKMRVLGRSVEVSAARDIRVGYRITLARAVEVEAARTLNASRFVLLPKVTEIDTVQPLDISKVVSFLQALELDTAHGLNPPIDNGWPVVDPGTGEILIEVSYGQVVSVVKTSAGLTVVTVDVAPGERA